jgi:hypothetical protein
MHLKLIIDNCLCFLQASADLKKVSLEIVAQKELGPGILEFIAIVGGVGCAKTFITAETCDSVPDNIEFPATCTVEVKDNVILEFKD